MTNSLYGLMGQQVTQADQVFAKHYLPFSDVFCLKQPPIEELKLKVVNLEEKFKLFDDYWSPRVVGELNGQYIKLAKFKGEMVWHSHENEDEFFQVIKGSIIIHLKEQSVTLSEGECFIVPKGVEHKPEAAEEAHVMMFEPKATAHTGTTESELTVEVDNQNWI